MRSLDYEALELQRFLPGAQIRLQDNFHIVADPFRTPILALSGLFNPVGSIIDKLRVGLLRFKLLSSPLKDILSPATQSVPLDSFLQGFGFSEDFIQAFFRPFYQGIFLAPLHEQSSKMFSFVFKMFAEAPASLPANGIGAISEQMREVLPESVDVKLSTRVSRLAGGSVELNDVTLNAPVVIVATEGPEAVRLLGGNISTAGSRGSICLYFSSADKPPIDLPILTLNGEKEGIVNNMFIPSKVAAKYAPTGKTLISTTIVGDYLRKSDAELESAVREQMRSWFGDIVDEWDLLRVYRIPHSQSAQNPDYIFDREQSLGAGLFVCGDHRNTPTLNGAMLSGRKAAQQALTYLETVS